MVVMNTLKRIYVMAYVVGAFVLLSQAVQGLIAGERYLGWAGVALTVAPIVLVLTLAMITRRVARTSANFPAAIFLGVIGLIMAVVDRQVYGGPELLPFYALGGLVSFLFYVFWYSRFGRVFSPVLENGRTLPDFELIAVDGTEISSRELTATPTILIFIRGNWCPLCMGQVNEMSSAISSFVDAGARVAFIAPQSVAKTRSLAKGRPDGLEFYSDDGNAAGRILKIDNPASLPLGMEILGYRSETVLPTVIVTRAGGEIIWTHQTDNYRVRPTPKALLDVIAGAD
jgi:peroxiredoxin